MLKRPSGSTKRVEHIPVFYKVSTAGHHQKTLHAPSVLFFKKVLFHKGSFLSVRQAVAINSTVLITLEMYHRLIGRCFWINIFLVAFQLNAEIESSTVFQAKRPHRERKAVNCHKPSMTWLPLLTHNPRGIQFDLIPKTISYFPKQPAEFFLPLSLSMLRPWLIFDWRGKFISTRPPIAQHFTLWFSSLGPISKWKFKSRCISLMQEAGTNLKVTENFLQLRKRMILQVFAILTHL